uniref:Glutaredoxin domain-containing protein n=1 Tax=Kalanchoe fedtschenkoi TaxID=63787 RepID=A0A7N0RG76_KALFE
MGCASSKRVEVASSDVYRPAPASFAVFDINSIQEPWVKVDHEDEKHSDSDSDSDVQDDKDNKTSTVPDPILQKLSSLEVIDSSADSPPQSWDQVSKVLEDLKPALHQKSLPAAPPVQDNVPAQKRVPRRSFSFHTIEELEKKAAADAAPKPISKTSSELKRFESKRMYELRKTELKKKEDSTGPVDGKNYTPVRENMFIKLDRMEMEKEGRRAMFDKMRRNPLYDYPDLCPPGGADRVVLYTTSLRGVRRTFEDCTQARTILELQRVVFDERDVSLHAEFLKELKDMLGGKCEEGGVVNVPKLFVKGRYVGGVDELVELNETGRLNRLLNSASVERGVGRQGCEGCGGARFVPCFDCGGSCKVVVAGERERCPECNENGLIQCPACN